jgi:hypothetical protein
MRASILLTGCWFLIACGSELEPPGTDPDPSAQTTWYQHVAPIVAEHCMSCHQAGGIAPFPLTSYDDVIELAPAMLAAVEAGIMPPWDAYATEDCSPARTWKDDPRLAADEIDLLRAWIADGMPAGEVVDIQPAPGVDLIATTHTLTPLPYVTSGTTDEFICFLLDPATTADTWLTGMHVRPGNAQVVHHAVVTSLPPAFMPEATAAFGIGEPFACSAGGAVPGSMLVGAWAPGGMPLDTAPDLGMPIAAGTGFIVQIHYHPAGMVNDPDATSIDLRLEETAPPYVFGFAGFGNSRVAPTLLPGPNDAGHDDDGDGVEFIIPAGAAGHTETMRFTVGANGGDGPGKLFMGFPHMHYVGTEIHAKVIRAAPAAGEPAEECLLNIDRWDFTWQRNYQYDVGVGELPVVEAGDVVEIKCTYENTLANPAVQLALSEQGLTAPIDIRMGEQTLDEMCLVLFGTVVER